ncbi:MAG TPA: hemerythrin domain-containing protein [Acidimicrobiales bacterium]|nr:hemerythrin domain-containing protein [Acidimicrobiales bacterium]
MADLVDVLRADHEQTLHLLDLLLRAPTGRGEDNLRANEMTQELVILCSGHEAVEEMHFWPAVRELVPRGIELTDAGLEQERAAKWVLHHLNGRVPEDVEYGDLLREFAEATRAHIAFEQDEVWPPFLEAVGIPAREELGAAAVRDKRIAPTRPHPGTPATPRVLGTAGRLTALADRALDAVLGRGRRFAAGQGGAGTAEEEPGPGDAAEGLPPPE